jgi:hypothetical protein
VELCTVELCTVELCTVELCNHSNDFIDINDDIFTVFCQHCATGCDHSHVPGIYWPADSAHCAVTRDKYGCCQSAYLILRVAQLLPAA